MYVCDHPRLMFAEELFVFTYIFLNFKHSLLEHWE